MQDTPMTHTATAQETPDAQEPKQTNPKHQPGAVVRLASGGPIMTVTGLEWIEYDEDDANESYWDCRCMYFDDQERVFTHDIPKAGSLLRNRIPERNRCRYHRQSRGER